MRLKAFLFFFLLLVNAASAEGYKVYGLNGGNSVFIWKDKDAHSEAMSLITAGVHKTNPGLVLRLMACTVPSGTMVVVTDMGFVTHDIMVVEGAQAGCRGNIAAENLKVK